MNDPWCAAWHPTTKVSAGSIEAYGRGRAPTHPLRYEAAVGRRSKWWFCKCGHASALAKPCSDILWPKRLETCGKIASERIWKFRNRFAEADWLKPRCLNPLGGNFTGFYGELGLTLKYFEFWQARLLIRILLVLVHYFHKTLPISQLKSWILFWFSAMRCVISCRLWLLLGLTTAAYDRSSLWGELATIQSTAMRLSPVQFCSAAPLAGLSGLFGMGGYLTRPEVTTSLLSALKCWF